jgi:peptidoglycan/xylan/chitin deacetylase (PgdA/CDA1 family)
MRGTASGSKQAGALAAALALAALACGKALDTGDAATGGAGGASGAGGTATGGSAGAGGTATGGTGGTATDGGAGDLPPGARCAPSGDGGAGATVPPPASSCPGETAEYTTSRPLGVGFPDGDDLLPPHVAYLTFDDGPSDWTGEFLDILAAEGVHATFFINAKNFKGPAGLDATYIDAAGNPAVFRDVVARAIDEGHVIGNHTVDHSDLAALDAADAAAELDENERLVNAALSRTGRPTRPLTLIRPPYGSPWFHHMPLPPDQMTAEVAVATIIAARGLDVMWTIDSSDSDEWAQGESFTRRPGQETPDPGAPTYDEKIARIEDTVLSDPAIVSGAGAVILMHDTHNATRDALAAIIDGLRAAGYSFGTIEDFATWRWGHPSLALTPGPTLYDACTSEGDWGCAAIGGALAADHSNAACGRFWRAFIDLGGEAALGAPLAVPARRASGGALYQPFASGDVELHPEIAAPCNVEFLPR